MIAIFDILTIGQYPCGKDDSGPTFAVIYLKHNYKLEFFFFSFKHKQFSIDLALAMRNITSSSVML